MDTSKRPQVRARGRYCMVFFNYATKEITAKIVYYGPGLCGKTTNLEFLHANVPEHSHGKLISLATKTDRTLFFDLLPVELGTIRGMKTRLQLYTVPGQVFYNSTRKLVLKGVDGIVFVVDSQEQLLEANVESYQNLKANLRDYGLKLEDIPTVIQFNKRDLPNILSVEVLNEKINELNSPIFEAVATTGIGVQETLRGITKLVLNKLAERDRAEAAVRGATGKVAAEAVRPSERPLAKPAPRPPAPPPRPRPAAPAPVAGGDGFDFQDAELDSFLSEGLQGMDEAEAATPVGDATVQLSSDMVQQAMVGNKAKQAVAAPVAAKPEANVWDVWEGGETTEGSAEEELPEVNLAGEGDFDDPFAGISLDEDGSEGASLHVEATGSDVDAYGAEAAFGSVEQLHDEGTVTLPPSPPPRPAPPPQAPPRPTPESLATPPPDADATVRKPSRLAGGSGVGAESARFRPREEEKIDFRAMLQEELDKENDPFFSPHLARKEAEPVGVPEAPAVPSAMEEMEAAAPDDTEMSLASSELPRLDDEGAEASWGSAEAPGAEGSDSPQPVARVNMDWAQGDALGESAAEGIVSGGVDVGTDDLLGVAEETTPAGGEPAPTEQVEPMPAPVSRREPEREIEIQDFGSSDIAIEVEPGGIEAPEAEPVAAAQEVGETVKEVDVPVQIALPRGVDRVLLRIHLRIDLSRR